MSDKKKTVIIGRPGTGKTHYLMELFERIDPRRTIFISFTRSAVWEAKKRAKERRGLSGNDIPYFRTIHSLCSKLLGLNVLDYLEETDIAAFMEKHGISYDMGRNVNVMIAAEEINYAMPEDVKDGNKFMLLLSYIKNVYCTEINALPVDQLNGIVSGYLAGVKFQDPRFDNIETVANVLAQFEEMRGSRLHYTDILMRFLQAGPDLPQGLDNLIVDEFQDLSPLSYKVVKYLEKKTSKQYYAGDPHQAIYVFMGANPHILLDEWNSDLVEHVNLPVSRRLKERVWDTARRIINNHSADLIKETIKVEEGGKVEYVDRQRILELLAKETRSVYVLTRTNAQKRDWQKDFDANGIPYVMRGRGNNVWDSKIILANNFIFAVRRGLPMERSTAIGFLKECVPSNPYLRRGVKTALPDTFKDIESVTAQNIQRLLAVGYTSEDLTNIEALKLDPAAKAVLQERIQQNAGPVSLNISLGTIHAHKGGEADVVIYDANISNRLRNDIEMDRAREEEEARIAYVAVTRAKEELYVVGGNTLVGDTG